MPDIEFGSPEPKPAEAGALGHEDTFPASPGTIEFVGFPQPGETTTETAPDQITSAADAEAEAAAALTAVEEKRKVAAEALAKAEESGDAALVKEVRIAMGTREATEELSQATARYDAAVLEGTLDLDPLLADVLGAQFQVEHLNMTVPYEGMSNEEIVAKKNELLLAAEDKKSEERALRDIEGRPLRADIVKREKTELLYQAAQLDQVIQRRSYMELSNRQAEQMAIKTIRDQYAAQDEKRIAELKEKVAELEKNFAPKSDIAYVRADLAYAEAEKEIPTALRKTFTEDLAAGVKEAQKAIHNLERAAYVDAMKKGGKYDITFETDENGKPLPPKFSPSEGSKEPLPTPIELIGGQWQ